ncbi:MAG: Dak phosphatase [Actinomycetia bacterium]|nr:Dak phosphatase [Actinomycetes bacterium]
MGTLERLDAGDVRRVVSGFRDALRSHQDMVNRLNVYPVPDGDTGTNMALTLESVVTELESAEPDMASVCKAISHGSLMGARGNSGVILSQILRGLATTFAESETCDGARLADGLVAAAAGAYGAVMRPIEGTILTVIRELSEAAKATAGGGASLVEVLDAARVAGHDALARTPELLAVLKEAGVVDAGGAGLLLLVDAALNVVDGRPLPKPEPVSSKVLVAAGHAVAGDSHGDVSDLRYEVMYFLEAPDDTIPAFKDVWAGIGDSIVVVGGDGIWNCHIHTDDIGASIEAALDCGRPRDIRVTDLIEQVEEERWVREAEPDASPALQREVATAVVAVATGDGIRRIFHSLGVQSVVTGGQSMNPSTAQLLAAVEASPAPEVVILPNNKNIIPVAEQVDELTTKTVRVVPTRGVTEGFAALLSYDPDAGLDANANGMKAAADNVVAGEVTRAVRASAWDGGPIAEGDWLGIARDGIRAVQPTLPDAVTALLEELVTDDHEIVTLIEGEGSGAGATRHVSEWLREHRPDVAVEVHHGGQPLYPYLIGIE